MISLRPGRMADSLLQCSDRRTLEGKSLICGELRASVRLQKTACRTPEDAYGNAFFRRDIRAMPEGLLGCPLDPIADQSFAARVMIDDKTLQHYAAALGTRSHFCVHVFLPVFMTFREKRRDCTERRRQADPLSHPQNASIGYQEFLFFQTYPPC